jgi:hypothetical protein
MRRGVYVCAAIVCAATGVVVRAQDGTVAPAPAESAYAACLHAHSLRIRVIYAVEECRPNETRIPWTITE